MIKVFPYVIFLSFAAACRNDGNTSQSVIKSDTIAQHSDATEVKMQPVKEDKLLQPVLMLKDPDFQTALLNAIDEWYIQKGDTLRHYQNDRQVIALNAKDLSNFAAKADLSKAYSPDGVHLAYQFDRAPAPYTDSPECEDYISLRYLAESDEYIFQLTNNYFVDRIENPDCYGSDNMIHFSIDHKKVTVTEIQHAG